MARLMCGVILLMEIIGLSQSLSGRRWMAVIFYTQLSNLVTALSALLVVALGQQVWITWIRYLSTCMLIMTFFVTTCVLIPMGGNPKKLLLSGSGLYHHLLCPVISTLSYILFENAAGKSLIWLPPVLTLAYGMIMLYLNAIGKVDGPYPFFRIRHQKTVATVLWMAVLCAAVTGISILVWVLS